MKNTSFFSLILVSFAFSLFLLSACSKDGIAGCETVVEGNQYLKVVNKSGGEIFVNMTSIIGIGAQVRNGACELYGLPTGNHTVTIDNEDEPGNRHVSFSLGSGETYEVEVGKGFF